MRVCVRVSDPFVDCRALMRLVQLHAKECQVWDCPVPGCSSLQVKRAMQQEESQHGVADEQYILGQEEGGAEGQTEGVAQDQAGGLPVWQNKRRRSRGQARGRARGQGDGDVRERRKRLRPRGEAEGPAQGQGDGCDEEHHKRQRSHGEAVGGPQGLPGGVAEWDDQDMAEGVAEGQAEGNTGGLARRPRSRGPGYLAVV